MASLDQANVSSQSCDDDVCVGKHRFVVLSVWSHFSSLQLWTQQQSFLASVKRVLCRIVGQWWGWAFPLLCLAVHTPAWFGSWEAQPIPFLYKIYKPGAYPLGRLMGQGVLTACLPIIIKGWAANQRRVAWAVCVVICLLEHCSDIKKKELSWSWWHTPVIRNT